MLVEAKGVLHDPDKLVAAHNLASVAGRVSVSCTDNLDEEIQDAIEHLAFLCRTKHVPCKVHKLPHVRRLVVIPMMTDTDMATERNWRYPARSSGKTLAGKRLVNYLDHVGIPCVLASLKDTSRVKKHFLTT